MRIGLITPTPDHPLLAATAALLTPEHRVEVVNPDTVRSVSDRTPADVYLLKSRTPHALALARDLERRGARVVNSATATARVQDRTEMADVARRAGLPFAPTRTFTSLSALADPTGLTDLPDLTAPVVVKSRHSRKHDLVARVDTHGQLRELAARHPEEPVVVQEFAPNSGWDHKLWAVGDQVFAALRRSELAPDGRSDTRSLALADLPSGWADLVRRVGQVFALDVYGVDVIGTGTDPKAKNPPTDPDAKTPLIVDINAFPGIRNQPGAPEALAAMALRTGRGVREAESLVRP
ncbi:RimK family alpha-L-glutamate ligase [Streptomyces sp. NPDC021093]|uniref:RimK family alpha-L-glutamate ligase n=1 Tax=Streptomyces sp. NPDC021093 TaxID=3365112 RepID=UPI00379E3BA2